MLTNEQINRIIADVYSGVIDVWNLPQNLYLEIAQELERSLYQGYGAKLSDFDINSPGYKRLNALRNNIYNFSSAKTFQQIKDMENIRYVGTTKVPFQEYKQMAGDISKIYNKTWQNVEEITTSHLADASAEWSDIKDDEQDFPLLEYVTVNDSRVRDEHQELDGIIRPVNDDFWTNYLPPNGWHCRCRVRQLKDGDVTSLSKRNIAKNPPLFDGNPGKRDSIFKQNHPYFTRVAPEFKDYKKRNFGMVIPEPE